MPRFAMLPIIYGLTSLLITSSELQNTTFCPEEYFSCNDNSRCLPYSLVCNGENDCPDLSDEKSCHLVTTPKPDNCTDQFRCLDGLCIPFSWVCNGEMDCLDESDEHLGCTIDNHCDGFRCKNGHCIPSEWKCDGGNDCHDGSDEINCPILDLGEECIPNNRKFLCKDKSNCIDLSHVCNRHADCADGSDEGGDCFSKSCGDGNHTCEQQCQLLPTGHECICFKGYKRIDGICKDIDECEIFGACDQICHNTVGSYNCSCQEGYKFDENVCKADGIDVMIIFATVSEVRIYISKLNHYFILANKLEHVVGVAYDGKHLYWTTIANGYESLMRADIFGIDVETLFTSGLGGAEDLAVDHVTSNIYFTDSVYKHIAVCDELGHKCLALYRDCDKPRAIVLHQSKGMMMWTDWGKKPGIMTAGMDGSNPKYLVTENIVWPNGLALDHVTERIYWADANLHSIETVKLDGTDRRKIISSTITPFGLDVFEDKIYWSDWEKKGIMACNKFNGKSCKQLVKSAKMDILGIHVYHPKILEKVDNPCLFSTCSHLCLLSPGQNNMAVDYVCKCPEGMELSSNQHTCLQMAKKNELYVGGEHNILRIIPSMFGKITVEPLLENFVSRVGDITYDYLSGRIIFSDLEKHSLMAMDVISNKVEVIASTRIGQIVGMDFDGLSNNLFWVDEELRLIEVMNLKDNKRSTLIRDFGSNIPLDLALNTEDGIMYVVVHQNGMPCIERVSIDGSLDTRIHMLSGVISGPRISLTYNQNLHRLYITDSSGKLASTDKNGHDYHVLKELPKLSPINIQFVGQLVFWTVYGSSSIYFDNQYRDLTPKVLDLSNHKLGNDVKLAAYRPSPINVTHECFWNNGNCSDICLPKGASKKCICENNLKLSEDGHTCKSIKNCEWDEFKCPNEGCIPLLLRCDSKPDCPNGEDELDCQHILHCESGTYKCYDKCIPLSKKCDKSDCHGDDCNEICTDEHFKCTSGQCIPKEMQCDSKVDCDDGSDEMNCTRSNCNPDTEFRCESGQCIPAEWQCDSQIDCSDGSDEHSQCRSLQTCDDIEFTCGNGHCIDTSLRCNGEDDCEDSTDERDCPVISTTEEPTHVTEPTNCKNSTDFFCTSSSHCLPSEIRCNGTAECPKGEDEVGCEGVCPVGQFWCSSSTCIPNSWVCDGVADCQDANDEQHCLYSTNVTWIECKGYECKDGNACISWNKMCDGKEDCKDGSDEGGLCGRSCETAGCDHKCIETPMGHRCSCLTGYQLSGDGRSCLDINECMYHFSCGQICRNTPGSYRCYCDHDYYLRTDRRRCKAKGQSMEYIYTTKNEIRRKSQNLREVTSIFKNHENDFSINGLDLDMTNRMVYWTRAMPGTLMKMSIDESDNKYVNHFIKDLNIPTKVAYDWITDQIYVVEQYRLISVCSFKVKRCVTLYTAKSDVAIKAIAFEAKTRVMFWTETKSLMFRSSYTVIKSGDMTARNIVDIVNQDIGEISDIAVDRVHEMIYWSDKEKKTIERSRFDGSLRETLHTIKHTPLEIGLFEEYIYWVNSVDSQKDTSSLDYITRCGLYGIEYNRCEKIRLLPSKSEAALTHLRLLHPALQSTTGYKGRNKCLEEDCDYLCLVGSKGAVCVCSDGERIESGEKCKITNETKTENELIENREGGSVVGWWCLFVIILIIILVGSVYYSSVLYHSTVTIPPVHFQNTSNENLSGILSNSNSNDPLVIPGKHEYENPLQAEIRIN